ncbi:hypothetical protein, variant [Capsaspora owczarzaki ATCC 30864]|uniref:Mannosyltransferase n=1 Tax=Capsaspora owczarzaki (strain ATCC 30864) TaxID=595528 RepID=A0A0D2WP10_CAPO3|nr:hypothetical protein, variant [Capsaspora owczarzaki ATCC 30864]
MASDSESYQADIENANSDDDDDDDNEDDNEDDDDSEDELANQAAGHYNRGVHYQESETTQNDDNNQDSANSDHWSPSEHQGESRTGRSAQTGAMLQPGGSTAKSTSAKPGVLAAVLKRLTTSSSARFGEFGPPQAKTRASKPKTRSASLLQQPSGSRGLGRSSSLQLKPLQRAGRRLDLAIVTKPRVLERFWWMYSLLMLVRAASIALPGYIHPDEFFQSPEVAARDVLELDSAFIPWEFANTETPSRSAVFPLLISGFPFALLKALFGTVAQIPPWALLIAPRIVMLFSSLVLDSQVLNAMRWLYPTQPALHATTLLVLASSFVTVVFHTRTFSNAMESVLLAALVGTLAFAAQGAERISLETPSANKSARRKASARPSAGSDAFVASVDVPPPSPSASVASPLALDTQRASKTAVAAVALLRTSSVVFGAVVVAGIFCRFTLVLFAAPLAVALQMLHYRVVCDVLVRRNGSVLAILSRLVRLSWIPLVASALLTTSGFVIFDSWYFGALEFGGSSVVSESIPSESPLASPFLLACLPTWNRLPVVAPLNNLLYNLNPANLEQHGLHPRYLHILVNMPLLFGPLVLALAAACCKFAFPPRSGVYQRCFILGTKAKKEKSGMDFVERGCASLLTTGLLLHRFRFFLSFYGHFGRCI